MGKPFPSKPRQDEVLRAYPPGGVPGLSRDRGHHCPHGGHGRPHRCPDWSFQARYWKVRAPLQVLPPRPSSPGNLPVNTEWLENNIAGPSELTHSFCGALVGHFFVPTDFEFTLHNYIVDASCTFDE